MAQHIVLIDPHCPCLKRIAHLNCSLQITGMHSRSEAICRRVAEPDGVVLIFEFGDGANGTEDLFLHYFHRFRDIGEDGRLDEVARVAVARAANFDFGALGTAGVDVATKLFVSGCASREEQSTD